MKFKKMALQVAVCALTAGVGFSAHAKEGVPTGDGSSSSVPGLFEAPQISRAYGPGTVWTSFHAARFVPKSGTPSPEYYGSGYIYPANTSASQYWTQFDLPNGAQITSSYIAYYDNDNAGYVYYELTGYESSFSNSSNPAYVSYGISDYASSDTPGFATVIQVPTSTMVVREYADIDGDGVGHLLSFGMTVYMKASATTSNVRFFGAGINWKRQIAPAPATASFGDVDTGHWAFKEIEALNSSGITAGCGTSGDFCPNDNVTRAQMAVFLARALGLHWDT